MIGVKAELIATARVGNLNPFLPPVFELPIGRKSWRLERQPSGGYNYGKQSLHIPTPRNTEIGQNTLQRSFLECLPPSPLDLKGRLL